MAYPKFDLLATEDMLHKCEFCGKGIWSPPPEGVIYGVDACFECEASLALLKREVERRYPDGIPPTKTFAEHTFVMEFEPSEDDRSAYRPTIRCTDACPEDVSLYRVFFSTELFPRMCSCEALHECFDDPDMWFDGMTIKVRPVYNCYQGYEGDWDCDQWVEVIGD